jgi:osomolarity two-component system, sensor histidine kinase TcsA
VETVKDYAIFMLDTKGNVRTWNAGAALLKGYKPEEIIGQHFSIFYGADDIIAEKPKKELEICLRDGKVEDESWRYRRDGSRFWANVIITCLTRNGIHIGILFLFFELGGRNLFPILICLIMSSRGNGSILSERPLSNNC